MAELASKFMWGDWPVDQFTQKLCELFGEDPKTASRNTIAIARSIAEALQTIPVGDPRGARICGALRKVAELDMNSQEVLDEAMLGLALEVHRLFQ